VENKGQLEQKGQSAQPPLKPLTVSACRFDRALDVMERARLPDGSWPAVVGTNRDSRLYARKTLTAAHKRTHVYSTVLINLKACFASDRCERGLRAAFRC
jgi:hypothetical protein